MDENQNATRQVVLVIGSTRAGMSIRSVELAALKQLVDHGEVAVILPPWGDTPEVRNTGPVTREELDALLAPVRFPEPRFSPVVLPRKAKTREAQWKAERNFTRPDKPRGRS